MLIQKYAEFNIELNAKDKYGTTAFHLACENGRSKTAAARARPSSFKSNLVRRISCKILDPQ